MKDLPVLLQGREVGSVEVCQFLYLKSGSRCSILVPDGAFI
jgi:hypothetical protein